MRRSKTFSPRCHITLHTLYKRGKTHNCGFNKQTWSSIPVKTYTDSKVLKVLDPNMWTFL